MKPPVSLQAALVELQHKVERKWPQAVCAELGVGDPVVLGVALRPGVSSGADVERLGYATWHTWHRQWSEVRAALPAGVEMIDRKLSVRGVTGDFPVRFTATLDGAVALLARFLPDAEPSMATLTHARARASAVHSAGGILTPATLRLVCRLADHDVQVVLSAVTWLREHPDARAWTLRQLPVPGMHTKWLETHGTLLRQVAGRDVREEVRARPAVLHVTYVDPHHLASGRRRHDAWTTGDGHDLAYRPRVVVVVENRDSRLWFPPVDGTLVVEGGGRAAAALVADVPWVRAAEHIVYWGDLDADGYAILDQFRAALGRPGPDGAPPKAVASILMDATDLHRYGAHGVNHDKAGRPITPSPAVLSHLTESEATAYYTLATAGPTPFRRIEQEAIPLTDAATRLLQITSQAGGAEGIEAVTSLR